MPHGEANPTLQVGNVRTTHAARVGAMELGLEFADMLAVVIALTPADFYKNVLIVSFKELGT